MPLTNYEKQKRWREKNRALYNLQQRNRRKKNLSGGSGRCAGAENHGRSYESASPPAQTFKDETLEKLRGLIKVEEEKPRVEAPVVGVARFGTFRDDDGRPITEAAHKQLQKLKEKADGRYEIGDYNQA